MDSEKNDQQFDLLKSENARLRTAVEELSILNDIATAISSTLDLDRVIGLIVQKCVKHVKVDQGAVWLLEEKNESGPLKTMVRTVNSSAEGLPYRLDTQLIGWMIKNQKPLIIQDLENDERFQITPKEKEYIRSLLAVPLQQKGKMIGVLTVFNKRSDEVFSGEDCRLLTIIGAQSAQVIEGARLYKEEQELLKMQQEMNVAAQIQMNLLPKDFPSIKNYETYGVSIPAKEVGGDYYDFIPQEDKRLIFCLGDVSGKGMPAALLMANLQATLRGQAISCKDAQTCLKRSNNLLYHSTDMEKYATMFYGILDVINHQLIYANAGHNAPYLVSKKGEVKRLKTAGIPLGWLEEFDYKEERVDINPGDVLVAFSDGISEAMNSREEEFEEERILEVIKTNMHNGPRDITDSLIKVVTSFTGSAPQSDDMTVVVIKRI
ncbi:MAG: GAF domain-containing protein [Calditrichales bacterium]|nr:MAG: GAF domain-containing protein [Calditrichales bacterium]